jgi:hypothetical protein
MTFSYRVDRWTDDGNSILDYVAAVGDLAVARAAYRAACRRWPCGHRATPARIQSQSYRPSWKAAKQLARLLARGLAW